MVTSSQRGSRWWPGWFWLLGLGCVVLDRLTKQLAVSGYQAHVPGFTFGLFKNTGFVFSLPADQLVILPAMIIGTTIVGWLAVRAWRKDQLVFLGAALMWLGATSNLFDRFRFGYVVDWAFFGPWWPVFNLADVFITVGLLLYLYRRVRD